ncbi:MAG: N-acetylglutamate synthase, partial [Actinomycetota bacterium]
MIRPAKTSDIKAIRKIIDLYTLQRRLLTKETVTLYEDV